MVRAYAYSTASQLSDLHSPLVPSLSNLPRSRLQNLGPEGFGINQSHSLIFTETPDALADPILITRGKMARRTHKKSRNGCIECKRRHMKVRLGIGLYMQPLILPSAMKKDLYVPTVSALNVTASLPSLTLSWRAPAVQVVKQRPHHPLPYQRLELCLLGLCLSLSHLQKMLP